MKAKLNLIYFSIFCFISIASTSVATVVPIDKPSVTLTGTITFEKFPNVNGGLEAWDTAILILDIPIDVSITVKVHHKKGPQTPNKTSIIPKNKRIQLFLPTGTNENSLKGKRIMVTGQLEEADNVHKHTPVVMDVKTIKVFKSKPTKTSK
jgi:hypothetical protein